MIDLFTIEDLIEAIGISRLGVKWRMDKLIAEGSIEPIVGKQRTNSPKYLVTKEDFDKIVNYLDRNKS